MPRRAVFPTISAMKLNIGSFNGDIVFVNGEHDPFRYDSSITVFDEIINYEATGATVGAYTRQRHTPNGVSIDNTDDPYQAKINDFILATSASGKITVLTPIGAKLGDRFYVKKTNVPSINLVNIDAITNGSQVESRLTHKLEDIVSLFAAGEIWTLIYDDTNWLIESIALDAPFTELWDATAIASVASGGSTIQWTFVPLIPGQLPLIVSHAAGVLTANVDIGISIKLDVLWTYRINSNNDDCVGLISDIVTGTGIMAFIEVVSSFTSPRSKAGGYPFSQNTDGIWFPDIADTLKFDASSDVLQSGDTDLTEALLFLSVG